MPTKSTDSAKKPRASSKKISTEEEIVVAAAEPEPEEDKSTVKQYEAFIEKQLDKEIIKSQRKMTAGKETGVKPKEKIKKPELKTEVKKPPLQSPVSPDGVVEIAETITVKEFSEKTGLNPVKIIGELMKNGIRANINQTIDFETALIIADDFGIKLRRKRAQATAQDISTGNLDMLVEEKDEKDLVVRPPVVTVMGHVDHGKTKLLDVIRETDIVSTEAGGITQHIGAYQVEKNGKKITFIDTPGHEAFSSLRSRGAKVTDIVILVVAADEGVKPQTIEALNHAKDAQVPIIVALNKIDKEGANVDRVKAQLAELGLQPEDWGGKTIMVPVSALSGDGIPQLLEMVLLVADLENLRANPHRPAVATVLEAHMDKNLGSVATVLVNTGTLHIHDAMIIGDIGGRVKTMKDHLGKNLSEALPSTPVFISGLSSPPHAGDILQGAASIEEARNKAEQIGLLRNEDLGGDGKSGLENIVSAIAEGRLKTLKVVLKADAAGSLDAIKLSLSQLKQDDISVKVIHSGVGDVNESDILLASAAGGLLLAFNAKVQPRIADVAGKSGVQILSYAIIYKMLDDVKKILTGLLEPEIRQVVLGQAEVRQVFLTEKKYMIVGCKIINGKMQNKARLRVLRNGEKIGEGSLDTLKKNNDNVHELSEGADCGIKFVGAVALQEKDVLEAWKEEKIARTLS